METNTKLTLSAALMLAGMHYLINNCGPAGLFLISVDCVLLMSLLAERRRIPWERMLVSGIVSLIPAELMLQGLPMAQDPFWQGAVLVGSLASALAGGWIGSFSQAGRREVLWRLDWCLGLPVLLGVGLTLLPLPIVRYVMQPLFLDLTSRWPLILLPFLMFMPFFALRMGLSWRWAKVSSVRQTSRSGRSRRTTIQKEDPSLPLSSLR